MQRAVKMLVIGVLATVLGVAGVRADQEGQTAGISNRLGTAGALDATTRKDAEETLARGVAWLQAQQVADGRIGSNRHVAVTALALAAARGAAAAITNYELRIANGGGKTLEKTDIFLRDFLATNPTNAGLVAVNAEVCRKVLHVPDPGGRNVNWAGALAYQDRDDSARAREFELREVAWRKQRAELIQQGCDPEQVAAEQLARVVVPAAPTAAGGSAVVSQGRGGSGGPTLPGGKRRRGYGSMTYDGMMALLCDDVGGNDARVDAIMDWAERGWSLDENPGKGKSGLFFFYHAMVKCLAASGEEEIVPFTGGRPIHWREEVVRKLVTLQHVDAQKKTGFWVNENPANMEDDPVLVTAYAMLSLEAVLGRRE